MRNLKKIALPAMLLAALQLTPALAGGPRHAPVFQDQARVVSSIAVYERVNEPRRECWTEQVGYETVGGRDRNYGGAIIGGIVGGVLGNQVGKGTGRHVSTAIGAATGAIVGDNLGNGRYVQTGYQRPIYEERCRTVDNWSQRLTGYDVTYRYQGRDYTAFMPRDPGPFVRVHVQVSLAE